MNTLEEIIPKIKRNLKKFRKPGLLYVRPGFRTKNGWPTNEKAIVAVTSRTGPKPKLPAKVVSVLTFWGVLSRFAANSGRRARRMASSPGATAMRGSRSFAS